MTFRVGQKVVCVDDGLRVSSKRTKGFFERLFERFRRFERLDHNLNKGEVYVVIGVEPLRDDTTQEVFETLRVGGAWHFRAPEIGFPSFQFRALLERSTDISIFTAMLTPKKTRVRA